jgi:hypothetical protein
LEQYRLRGRTSDAPLLGSTSDTDVVSLSTMSIRPKDQTIKRCITQRSMM